MGRLPVLYSEREAIEYPTEFCRYIAPIEYIIYMEQQIFTMIALMYNMLNWTLSFMDAVTSTTTFSGYPYTYRLPGGVEDVSPTLYRYWYGYNNIPFRTEVADAFIMGGVANKAMVTSTTGYPSAPATPPVDIAPSEYERETYGDIKGDHVFEDVNNQDVWISQNPDLGAVHVMRKIICIYLIDLPLRASGGSNVDAEDRPVYGKLNNNDKHLDENDQVDQTKSSSGYRPLAYPGKFHSGGADLKDILFGYTTNAGQFKTNLLSTTTGLMPNILKYSLDLHQCMGVYKQAVGGILGTTPTPDADAVDHTRESILYNDSFMTNPGGTEADQEAADAASVAADGSPVYDDASNSALAHCARVALLKNLIDMKLYYGWS